MHENHQVPQGETDYSDKFLLYVTGLHSLVHVSWAFKLRVALHLCTRQNSVG